MDYMADVAVANIKHFAKSTRPEAIEISRELFDRLRPSFRVFPWPEETDIVSSFLIEGVPVYIVDETNEHFKESSVNDRSIPNVVSLAYGERIELDFDWEKIKAP